MDILINIVCLGFIFSAMDNLFDNECDYECDSEWWEKVHKRTKKIKNKRKSEKNLISFGIKTQRKLLKSEGGLDAMPLFSVT